MTAKIISAIPIIVPILYIIPFFLRDMPVKVKKIPMRRAKIIIINPILFIPF